MDTVEQIKNFIYSQRNADESIVEQLYDGYASEANQNNEKIRESFLTIEECTREMPFEQSDRICSAVVAACVECERLAFLDGLSTGAKLILELTEG